MRPATLILMMLSMLMAFAPRLSAVPGQEPNDCDEPLAQPLQAATLPSMNAVTMAYMGGPGGGGQFHPGGGERGVLIISNGGGYDDGRRYHGAYWYGFGGVALTVVLVSLLVLTMPQPY